MATDYNKEELEELLKHEQYLIDKCEDEYTKGLLENRLKMYQTLISQIDSKETV
jgi:hypothetical protein